MIYQNITLIKHRLRYPYQSMFPNGTNIKKNIFVTLFGCFVYCEACIREKKDQANFSIYFTEFRSCCYLNGICMSWLKKNSCDVVF